MDINYIENKIKPIRNKLLNHRLYSRISKIEDLQTFTENHIYAVWDFMSILKSLQHHICPSSYPWKRNVYTTNGIARLINEIVLAEESDEIMNEKYISHFDLYI